MFMAITTKLRSIAIVFITLKRKKLSHHLTLAIKFYLRPISERPQYFPITSKSNSGKYSKRQLQTHHSIQNIIQIGHVVNSAVKSCEESGHHGNASSEENALPASPSQIQESLHGELACIGACHGGALSGCEDSHRPYVGCCYAKGATKEDSSFVDVG